MHRPVFSYCGQPAEGEDGPKQEPAMEAGDGDSHDDIESETSPDRTVPHWVAYTRST
jgi:hypothetical protein